MKGMCFKEPLFHAMIDGRKTQTRRTAKPQPKDISCLYGNILFTGHDCNNVKPRYKKGEILYIKEPYIDDLNMDKTYFKYSPDDVKEVGEWLKMQAGEVKSAKKIWKNKLFMPESVARYFIKITDVRVERLKDITEEDCMKEGIEDCDYGGMQTPVFGISSGLQFNELGATPIKAYAALIDQINGKGTWESNPWVFVYDYELMPF